MSILDAQVSLAAIRFLSKVRTTIGGCWNWTGHTHSKEGYGHLRHKGKKILAHRFSFELHGNRLEPGMVIDHICRNRLCVNPKHLRMVTREINSLENSIGASAINAQKTHCPRGHELVAAYFTKEGRLRRRCPTCRRKQNIEAYQRRKARLALSGGGDGE